MELRKKNEFFDASSLTLGFEFSVSGSIPPIRSRT
jgi:hypothetical protein